MSDSIKNIPIAGYAYLPLLPFALLPHIQCRYNGRGEYQSRPSIFRLRAVPASPCCLSLCSRITNAVQRQGANVGLNQEYSDCGLCLPPLAAFRFAPAYPMQVQRQGRMPKPTEHIPIAGCARLPLLPFALLPHNQRSTTAGGECRTRTS